MTSPDTMLPLPKPVENDPIFQPLKFRSGLVVKNRLFRSNISGRFDHYNGHGTDARITWEESFALGGVGTIISSFVPVNVRGRILPNYAMIDDDDKLPFWKTLARCVHEAGRRAWPDEPSGPQSDPCAYIMQLSHSGRQQDSGGVENRLQKALSATSRNDYFHGILCQAMTRKDIHDVVEQFAKAAGRAKAAGLDGVELHGAHGYLFTQFLSSAINDRSDEYGGSLRNRARFLLEVIKAIQDEVNGKDTHGQKRFHVQLKINAVDFDNALYPWRKKGNTLEESLEICDLAVQEQIDALHISSGSIFPHPRSPAGDFPLEEAIDWYDGMLSSGVNARFNYRIFTTPVLGQLFRWWWNYRRGVPFEAIQQGVNLELGAAVRRSTSDDVKVLVTGGFQHAFVIREALKHVDGVSIARPLIANRNLPRLFRKGMDWEHAGWIPEKEWPLRNRNPCTYCNKCLLNDLENPLGCYEQSRYPSHQEMIKEVMEVFTPRPGLWDCFPPCNGKAKHGNGQHTPPVEGQDNGDDMVSPVPPVQESQVSST
jgi:2,4-dienoyl-CoA reductase-like NADH-dependent reductase (Old Yellow Enzyme family)